MSMNFGGPACTGRRHDIDAMRVLAFALLILYHVGMFYIAPWDWHVKSEYLSETLKYPMPLVNQWRMPLLFLISGVAVHFLLGRTRPMEFARMRCRRLLLPLLFGMAVVVPPQAYFQAVRNDAINGGYGEFLWRYFTFQGWPPGAFDGWQFGVTWNHLWFLVYLLVYTLALTALLPALQSGTGQRMLAALRSLRGWRLAVIPVLPFILYAWTLRGRFPETHALFDDFYAHAVYFTIFLVGFAIGNDAGLWGELKRLRHRSLYLGLATFATFMTALQFWPEHPALWQLATIRVLICFNAWFWLLAVLGWGHHLLNRPFRWLPYASEAVFSWYVLHQTLTVALGFYRSRLTLGPVIEPVLVIAGTILGCLLLHELLIRRVGLLRPLFGLKPPASDRRRSNSARGPSPGLARPVESAVPSCNSGSNKSMTDAH